MTKDDPLELPFQVELRCDDIQQQQQQQKPFHVVLVDIEKAANDKTIHCVEKPLDGDTEELSFVALSYRWGELNEQLVDTECDYIASITSFALENFYGLCYMMTMEPNLKSIKYVWVDALCVDQTNYERRKATIHQMTNIYEKATYILAVPDLHKQHLKNVSETNADIMNNLFRYSKYIYYLIQGNTEKLRQLDSEFLDLFNVPKDPMLRRMLTEYTDCFTYGFTKNTDHFFYTPPEVLVGHLYDISQAETLTNNHSHADVAIGKTRTQADRYASFEDLFGCNKKNAQAEEWWKKINATMHPVLPWKDLIIRRNNAIRQVIKFLMDLIRDWSSRVWVISEYHIAKKKNNMKFWFVGFDRHRLSHFPWSFFGFDFVNSTLSSAGRNDELRIDQLPSIYLQFNETMARQLVTRCFFEKMLCSKASKIEDRFYAILPQSKYKDNMNQVPDWNINNMTSIKLKLFEIMDTKDKLNLLFLAGFERPPSRSYRPSRSSRFELMTGVLPTFATSSISKSACNFLAAEYPLNFDSGNKSTITLHHHAGDSHLYYFLQLVAKKYCVIDLPSVSDDCYDYSFVSMMPMMAKACGDLELKFASSEIKIVCLTYFDESTLESDAERDASNKCKLYLFGSFGKNKWRLITPKYFDKWSRHYVNNNGTVFNIY